jgi:type IV pilus assembly protein PilM
MTKIGIGLDIGTDSTKVVVGRMKQDFFVPLKVAVLRDPDGGQGSLTGFLNELKISGGIMLGVTGKEMIIRYTQVTPMPDWQLKQVMGFEIDDLAIQSGGDLSADFNRLAISSTLSEDDTILLTLIKNSLLEDRMERLKGSKVSVEAFTPNAIALYNLLSQTADIHEGTSLILGIGANNMDLAIVQEGSLIFARNLSGGSNLFNQALEESFNLKPAQAEKVKKELGCIITRNSGELSAQQERVGRSLSEAAGKIYSMVQSSLMFCKAQIKVSDLALDRVFLTGGGARLKGLDASLSETLGVPVQMHDPAVEMDIAYLEDASDFVQNGQELSCALGLAVMSATPQHYAIHVLPEVVKKRQHFKAHTLFGLLTALLLLIFLGLDFYLSHRDAGVLERDKAAMTSELRRRERWTTELNTLTEQNDELSRTLNVIDEKTIPTAGLVHTFALLQEYMPDDLWITTVEVKEVAREEFGLKEKKPIIMVRGSGREMGQSLQNSFTQFRQNLENDPRTQGVIPQVRYGDEFSFSLLINFSCLDMRDAVIEEGEEEDEEI